jgi:hypothetical protein
VLSLDDIIASRSRQSQTKTVPKKVSNTDRSIATARAKRSAAMAARRGLSNTPKATKMEIDEQVTKQAGKTAAKMAKKQPPTAADAHLSGQDKARKRRHKRAAKREAHQASSSAVVSMVRPPPKKAVKAAVNAMEQSGFQIPAGTLHVLVVLAIQCVTNFF